MIPEEIHTLEDNTSLVYASILFKNDFSSSPMSSRTVIVDISRLGKGPFSMQ